MKKFIGRSFLLLQAVSLTAMPLNNSWAVSSNMTSALKYDESKIKVKDVDVENFCSMFVDATANSQHNKSWTTNTTPRGDITPEDAWPSDQWCADHGSITDTAVGPTSGSSAVNSNSFCDAPITNSDLKQFASQVTDPNPNPSASPTTHYDGSKNAPQRQSVCRNVNKMLMRCKFKNSQVESQCLAYETADEGKGALETLLALDTTAAIACTTACAATFTPAVVVSAPATLACMGAGAFAATDEFIQMAKLNSSPVVTALHGIGIAAGGTAAGLTGAATIQRLAEKTAENTGKNSTEKAQACTSAAVFVAFSVIRGVNLVNISSAKDDAAKNVQKFMSDAAVTGGSGPAGANVNLGNYTPSNGTETGAASAGSGSGNGSAASQTVSGNGSNGTDGTSKNGSLDFGAALAGTPDAQLLRQSGLDKALHDEAKQLKASGTLKNGDAAGVIAQGASGAGDIGQAMAALAAEVKRDPGSMGVSASGSTPMYAGGGGGSGGGAGAAASNPFANLFGAKDGGGALGAGASTAQFNSRTPSSDIWHTGTSQNIFQIVSDKVSQVTSRVLGNKTASK